LFIAMNGARESTGGSNKVATRVGIGPKTKTASSAEKAAAKNAGGVKKASVKKKAAKKV
jgi:hypothetical protein